MKIRKNPNFDERKIIEMGCVYKREERLLNLRTS